MAKNDQKCFSYAIKIFSIPVVSMVISPLLRTVADIKMVLAEPGCILIYVNEIQTLG